MGSDIFPYGSPVIPYHTGDLIDGRSLVVEISYHQKVLYF